MELTAEEKKEIVKGIHAIKDVYWKWIRQLVNGRSELVDFLEEEKAKARQATQIAMDKKMPEFLDLMELSNTYSIVLQLMESHFEHFGKEPPPHITELLEMAVRHRMKNEKQA